MGKYNIDLPTQEYYARPNARVWQIWGNLHVFPPCATFLYFLLSFYWLVLIHIPWPNSGDYGMNLPMNLLSWAAILLQVLIVWLSLQADKIRLTPTFLCLLLSAIAFTLPVFWSPDQGLAIALPRLIGIWGGVYTYLTLL